MTFTTALAWCRAQNARWTFHPAAGGTAYVLRVDVAHDHVETWGITATDWGCMLMEAVECLAARSTDGDETVRFARVSTVPPRDGVVTADAFALA